MRAAVVIDDYKLPIFARRLREAGFTWRQCTGITAGTTTLQVEFGADEFDALHMVLRSCESEARRSRDKRRRGKGK